MNRIACRRCPVGADSLDVGLKPLRVKPPVLLPLQGTGLGASNGEWPEVVQSNPVGDMLGRALLVVICETIYVIATMVIGADPYLTLAVVFGTLFGTKAQTQTEGQRKFLFRFEVMFLFGRSALKTLCVSWPIPNGYL